MFGIFHRIQENLGFIKQEAESSEQVEMKRKWYKFGENEIRNDGLKIAEKLKYGIRIKFCLRDTVVKSSVDIPSEIPNMRKKILFSTI